MYPNLKLQIFKLGLHQNRVAKELGIADAVLSKIIHGYREPSVQERQLLASYLAVDEQWLFEECDVTTATPLSTSANQDRSNGGH